MAGQIDTAQRDIIPVEDAHIRPMTGDQLREPLPSNNIPCSLADPFILAHETIVTITAEQARLDTTHRTQFGNLSISLVEHRPHHRSGWRHRAGRAGNGIAP